MADPSPWRVEVLGRLDPGQVAEVSALVDRATAHDGVRPLSEHVRLHLRHGGDSGVRSVLVSGERGVVAYAQLDLTDPVEGASAELVVDPAARRRGVASQLVRSLLDQSGGRLQLWAHGEHPAAAVMARALGFEQVRSLWQMRRSLATPLPAPTWPDGVRVRAFEPGVDDEAWVALNAKAFAGHPEQGRWTVEDLRLRIAEPWFDPAGFFIAVRQDGNGERPVGFHWTKVHGAERPFGEEASPHGHEPIGEVYVVGVDPAEQGRGLGKALTLVGLAHLRSLGLGEVMLYVEADNAAAVAVYTDLGFTHADTDVMFRSGPAAG